MSISIIKRILSVWTIFFLSGISISLLAENMIPSKPVINFKLPMFGEDGYKTWSIAGKEGHYLNPEEILIKTMDLKMFSGKEVLLLDTQIQSSEALIFINKKIVKGDKEILVSADNYEITGKSWEWDANSKKITVNKDVRVLFSGKIDNVF